MHFAGYASAQNLICLLLLMHLNSDEDPIFLAPKPVPPSPSIPIRRLYTTLGAAGSARASHVRVIGVPVEPSQLREDLRHIGCATQPAEERVQSLGERVEGVLG